MLILLFALAILSFTFQNISFKQFNMGYMKNPASYFLFTSIFFAMVTVMYLAVGIDTSLFDLGVAALGLMFAVSFITAIYLFMKAMENGPLGLSFLFFSAGIIVPILFGIIVYNEPAPLHRFAGLVLLFIAFFISTMGKSGGKMSKTWVIYILLGSLFNGIIGLSLKLIPSVMPDYAITEFLFLGFGQGAIIAFIVGLFLMKRYKMPVSHFRRASFIFVAVLAAVTTAGGNYIMARLSLLVSALVQFPVVSGSLVITSIITSRLVYKEEVTKQHYTAIAIGLAAIVMLSM